MQGGRGRGRGRGGAERNPFFELGDPFAGFGGFGSPGNLMSGFFGGGNPFSDPFFSSPFSGRSPFSDPFFTRPIGESMFGSGFFGSMGNPFANRVPSGFIGHHEAPEPRPSRGPIIEEIDSDDEEEDSGGETRENPRKHRRLSNSPYVEDPDDVAEEKKSRQLQHRNNYNEFNQRHAQPQSRSFTFQSSTVTYGGPNGAYYTSSTSRRSGSDGVTFEETKEADTSTRQATHKVSRGLRNKGHSYTRKLNSDGKVDTMQALHNLNEDELPGFEEAWKGTAQKHLPGWTGNFGGHENAGASGSGQSGRGGWALPSTEPSLHSDRVALPSTRDNAGSSRSQHSSRTRIADTRDRNGFPRGRARD